MDHHGELWRVVAGQAGLPFTSDRDQALNVTRAGVGRSCERPGVRLGLEQARHEVDLERLNADGGGLEADERAEVLRHPVRRALSRLGADGLDPLRLVAALGDAV